MVVVIQTTKSSGARFRVSRRAASTARIRHGCNPYMNFRIIHAAYYDRVSARLCILEED
jgi:hypothetical protein